MGRVVQQFRNVSSNNLQVNNLKSGLYNIKVEDVRNGTQFVERVAVTGSK
jgi:hypothetical protein